MRTVVVIVGGIVVRVHKIPAIHIVDAAVAVVVDAVPGDFAGVFPRDTGEILMGEIHAGIEDRHEHFGSGRDDTPEPGGIHIRADAAAILPGILQRPLCGEARIIRRCAKADTVGIDVKKEIRARFQQRLRAVHGVEFVSGELEQQRVGAGQIFANADTAFGQRGCECGG